MANPVCLSPLKFYDDPAKQSHHKSYAFGHISPLIVKLGYLPVFQFVLPSNNTLNSAYIRNIEGQRVTGDIKTALTESGFSIVSIKSYYVVIYGGNLTIASITYEGQYYLELNFSGNINYYSEVFCATNATNDCIEVEYWNRGNNSFYIKNGVIAFPGNFHFKLLLKTELGKPEYNFEEEATKRLGYSFVESQVSKKVYKFNVVVPEFICDAMRIIRLCSDKIIRSKSDEYEAITFEMEADWQTQGDLASVTCEFETDNVVANLGGFVPIPAGGDYNSDYNEDFDNQ